MWSNWMEGRTEGRGNDFIDQEYFWATTTPALAPASLFFYDGSLVKSHTPNGIGDGTLMEGAFQKISGISDCIWQHVAFVIVLSKWHLTAVALNKLTLFKAIHNQLKNTCN